jgi:hypothetical protein
MLKDRLVNNFYDDELNPIQTDNRYHSPEVSETDDNNPNERKIIVRDFKWRSATVILIIFFFFFIFDFFDFFF